MRTIFTDEIRASQLDRVITASLGTRLLAQDAHYPDLDEWGQRVDLEVRAGLRQIIAAFNHRTVAGSIISRPDATDPRIIDVRRISILEEGRGIGYFLLRNFEEEAIRRFPEAQMARVDTKVTHVGMRLFLRRLGYKLMEIRDLYGLGGGLDAVYTKPLQLERSHQ
jgi:hypothetical protein